MADESLAGQTPWLEHLLGPIIYDANGNQFEPRTAGLHFVGASYAFDPVANIRRITFSGTGGSGLPLGSTPNALLRWSGTEAVYTLMTAAMHGQQTDGGLHEAVTGSKNGFATPEMLAAINGINSAISSAVNSAVTSLTTLINQKMNAFGIGVGTATLSSGTRRVDVTLPADARVFLSTTAHSQYEGRIEARNVSVTGFDLISSDNLDDSTVNYLWIKL